ncbi:MAG TPA: alpha-ribazole phosphatase family protein [Syntrophomonas sp.]|nr:alpha-ribazole phosphatase family protein [Syntrophomonas sp.]
MENLYLMRHGETKYSCRDVYYGSIDCPLNEKGLQDGASLRLIMQEIPLDIVIASPLIRARDTAAIILEERDIPLIYDDRLKEIRFGAWEGVAWSDLAEDTLWQAWSKDWLHVRPPGGETFVEMTERARSFYEYLLKRPEANIAIIAHNMVMVSLVTIMMEIPTDAALHFHFSSGCYSHFFLRGTFPILEGHNLK